MPKFREQIATPQSAPSPVKPNVVEYLADSGGCGHWRLIWPAQALMLQDKAFIEQKNRLVHLPEYYNGISMIRMQRQANPSLVKPYEGLANAKSRIGYRMVYESDDIIFKEDLPDYNGAKKHFNEQSTKAAIEIISMCDEITVSTEFLADYYRQKTGHKNITVIPNYAPRHWLDRYYDREQVQKKFENNSKKPRILYPGSPCHVNLDPSKRVADDFTAINEIISKTTDEFQWVFLGSIPMELRHLHHSGRIEFHPWCSLQDYPKTINSLNVNAFIAPLIDNTFNRAKSDVKYLEAGCFGLPCVCQNICTYQNADITFDKADELIDNLRLLKDINTYMKYSDKARAHADTRWLEDNTDKFLSLYGRTPGFTDR